MKSKSTLTIYHIINANYFLKCTGFLFCGFFFKHETQILEKKPLSVVSLAELALPIFLTVLLYIYLFL